MFANQSFKQNLEFNKNGSPNDVVKITIAVNTNHKIDENILKDIEEVISTLFLDNYTDANEVKQIEKEQKQMLPPIKKVNCYMK